MSLDAVKLSARALGAVAAITLSLLLTTTCGPATPGNSVDLRVDNYGVNYPKDGRLQEEWVADSVHQHALLVDRLVGKFDTSYPRAALIVLHRDQQELADALSRKFQQSAGQQPQIAAALGWVWDGEVHLVMIDPERTLGGLTELLIHHNIGDPGHVRPEWAALWWGEEWALVGKIRASR